MEVTTLVSANGLSADGGVYVVGADDFADVGTDPAVLRACRCCSRCERWMPVGDGHLLGVSERGECERKKREKKPASHIDRNCSACKEGGLRFLARIPHPSQMREGWATRRRG